MGGMERTERGPLEGRVHRPGGPSRLQGKPGSGGGRCPLGLTVSGHAQGQAFLQAAVLAAVPAGAVDGAVLLAGAGVGHAAVLAPAEEALGRQAETRLLVVRGQASSATQPTGSGPSFPRSRGQFRLLPVLA